MAFIIDKDLIDDGEMVGHWWSMRKMTKERCNVICKHKFRLLDDDDIVYFEGRSSDSSSFAALDWSMGQYGCTDIQYLEGKKWVSL